ncbi:Vacuolar protein sorting-associated protein 9A [Apostasia shenzhenica]|uniref:Vacuolar protein sorting-associated protein 9A n=1 Tax=Apostasia shenzhenica TaxID=1088818 RepID=A0A2I0AVF1_9ASPA|nr:Vacuolar protein sorting-associated protein 9A [Apostasia shenzhenica]
MDGGGGGGGGASDAFGSSTAPLAWHDFLERMRHPSAADFVKSIKSFIVSFSNRAPDPEKDSAAVQEFLASMEGAFRAHMLWAGSSEEELESAGEGLEKYVMTKLFNRAFASLPEDVQRDEELFEKMALLQQFIRPENLDIKPQFQNETSWLLAQKELQKINMYKAPRDKLVCILNCCRVINNLLLNVSISSNENPPGADEFLPVLIYVTVKANPPQLHSNLVYIQRYRRQSRLVSEAAYFFTNILSTESFIWSINGEALTMDETEFQKKMESSRAHLLGLSINTEENRNQTTENIIEHSIDTSRSQGESQSQVYVRENKDHEKAEQNASRPPSISDLETKGVADLVKEDELTEYFKEYPYLYASAGDLTVDDVESLLSCYKTLVLKYVSLCKGMGSNASTFLELSIRTDSKLENELASSKIDHYSLDNSSMDVTPNDSLAHRDAKLEILEGHDGKDKGPIKLKGNLSDNSTVAALHHAEHKVTEKQDVIQ